MQKSLAIMAITILLGACSTLAYNDKVAVETSRVTEHEGGFIARKGIEDGYVITFHVMRAPEGMGYSRVYYHLMVNIVKDKKPLTNLQVSSKVKHPNGTAEKMDMMLMGKWYMARYNLNHEQGRHWITVWFEVAGKQYSSGIYYPEIDFSEQSR